MIITKTKVLAITEIMLTAWYT